ncbi:hypothetical protein AYI69_g10653 [Smittium culicis]|uniref:Uncharacterized protein n=1 Tax=Smittium culicis TaxID=133412 RepID=A0A1R1X4C8_9FUNG|nr:hypothetical protein AYI69_g10653 [Smittium culicis]
MDKSSLLLLTANRKWIMIAIHPCPRNISMNYNPPQLNDSASKVSTTVTQERFDKLHLGLELPGKPTQLDDTDTKSLMDQETLNALIAKKKTSCEASTLLQLLLKQVQTTKNSTASQIFAGEVEAAERGLNRDTGKPPSWRTPRYVQIGMVQTDEQPMGSEHKVIQYENSAEVRICTGDNFDSGAVPVSEGA